MLLDVSHVHSEPDASDLAVGELILHYKHLKDVKSVVLVTVVVVLINFVVSQNKS